MKLSIALVALALIALSRIAAGQESSTRPVVMRAEYLGSPSWYGRRHRLHDRWSGWYRLPVPLTCDAVMFPRSPYCAGIPATLGPYSPNWRVYW
jgi:hypothetical protein